MRLVRGTDLPPDLRREVLDTFLHRWTRDNPHRVQAWGTCPLCDIREPYVNPRSAEGHRHPTVPLISDAEWLATTGFWVTRAGRLSRKHRSCEPHHPSGSYRHDRPDRPDP